MSDLFKALADEDARAEVPPHVHHAVMRAWAARQQQRPEIQRRWWAGRRTWLAVPAALLLALAGAWLWRREAPAPIEPAAVEYTEREVTADYALAVDPGVEAATLSVMRVRLSRSVLASLGVPVAQPDAPGMVEVELVVGEDGVARAIRSMTLVPGDALPQSQEQQSW